MRAGMDLREARLAAVEQASSRTTTIPSRDRNGPSMHAGVAGKPQCRAMTHVAVMRNPREYADKPPQLTTDQRSSANGRKLVLANRLLVHDRRDNTEGIALKVRYTMRPLSTKDSYA
uniref:hypothetical protein n=1 Tax=Aminobacter niigataensis TaxID=83265 RepID=UPI0028527CFE|nr:hypothetical protein [Aminobacter niigataensis]